MSKMRLILLGLARASDPPATPPTRTQHKGYITQTTMNKSIWALGASLESKANWVRTALQHRAPHIPRSTPGFPDNNCGMRPTPRGTRHKPISKCNNRDFQASKRYNLVISTDCGFSLLLLELPWRTIPYTRGRQVTQTEVPTRPVGTANECHARYNPK